MAQERTVGEIYRKMDEFAPFARAESWDNSGLLIGGKGQKAERVLVTLDITPRTIERLEAAAAAGAPYDLVVTHHPIIFKALKKVEADSLVWKLVRLGTAVISAHTNLDVADGGVNDCLAAQLGLADLEPLEPCEPAYFYKVVVFVPNGWEDRVRTAMAEAGAGWLGSYSCCSFSHPGVGRFLPMEGSDPFLGSQGTLEEADEHRIEVLCAPERLNGVLSAMKKAHPYEVPAYDVFEDRAVSHTPSLGRIGTLPEALEPREFARLVRDRLGCQKVKLADGGRPVQRVAICGGAGSSLVYLAKGLGADALVTGDCKHNIYLDASAMGISLVDAGHHPTEQVVVEPLAAHLREWFPELTVETELRPGDVVEYI